jgi:hypothetical protein
MEIATTGYEASKGERDNKLELRVQGCGPKDYLFPQDLGFTLKPQTRSVFPVAFNLTKNSSGDFDHMSLNHSSPKKKEKRKRLGDPAPAGARPAQAGADSTPPVALHGYLTHKKTCPPRTLP